MAPEIKHQVKEVLGLIIGGKIIRGKGHIVPFNGYKESGLLGEKTVLLNNLSDSFHIRWKRIYIITEYEGGISHLVKGEDKKRKNFYFDLENSHLCSMESSILVTEEMDLTLLPINSLFHEK